MVDFSIIPAVPADAECLKNMFFTNLGANPEYISHGEVQMGVGLMEKDADGEIRGTVAPDGESMWMNYINEKISSDAAAVYKAVRDGEIIGFCVADIESDGADPFGMVCDVLVKSGCRGGGIGQNLLNTAIEWLRGQGIRDIYLESGKNNHSAHRFFEKRGFAHISEIFKLF